MNFLGINLEGLNQLLLFCCFIPAVVLLIGGFFLIRNFTRFLRTLTPDEQALLRQSVARLPEYSSVVSALVERLRLVCADVPPPPEAPDMVHTDLNPSNVLVRDGAVVAVVDIGNAGSGTRATDLINLVWFAFQDPLDGVRRRLWTRILVLVGWEGAAVLAATQILHMLEFPIRQGRHDAVPGLVERGHRALDELHALR